MLNKKAEISRPAHIFGTSNGMVVDYILDWGDPYGLLVGEGGHFLIPKLVAKIESGNQIEFARCSIIFNNTIDIISRNAIKWHKPTELGGEHISTSPPEAKFLI